MVKEETNESGIYHPHPFDGILQFLIKKTPKQVEGYFPKFAIAFMVTFTILNEAIDLLYTILH